MTFIPRDIVVGDHVRINTEMSNEEGTFQAGHQFEVIAINIHGNDLVYDLRDHDLHLLGDVAAGYVERVPG